MPDAIEEEGMIVFERNEEEMLFIGMVDVDFML